MMPADTRTKGHAACAAAVLGLACASAPEAGEWSGSFLGASAQPEQAMPEDLRHGAGRVVNVGYNQDFGVIVLGGEVAYRQGGSLTGRVAADQSQRVQVRAGYDFGGALGYVTYGGTEERLEDGYENSSVFGLGVTVSLNRAFQLSGEVLNHAPSANSVPGAQPAQTLAITAAFQF